MAKKNCHDCHVKPGELHHNGCDVERCPWCGHQRISCDCEGKDAWIAKNRLPWTGIWPGTEEAAEFNLWSRWVPNLQFERDKQHFGIDVAIRRLGGAPLGRWEICTKNTPGATPDLNRLHEVAVWDRKQKRFVKALGVS